MLEKFRANVLKQKGHYFSKEGASIMKYIQNKSVFGPIQLSFTNNIYFSKVRIFNIILTWSEFLQLHLRER